MLGRHTFGVDKVSVILANQRASSALGYAPILTTPRPGLARRYDSRGLEQFLLAASLQMLSSAMVDMALDTDTIVAVCSRSDTPRVSMATGGLWTYNGVRATDVH